MVSSATATEFPPGVFITTTPFRVAASTSMLSTPTPARPMTFSRPGVSSTSAVTLVELRTASTSYCPTMAFSAAGARPSFTSTVSSGALRSVSRPSGDSSSATRTFIVDGAPALKVPQDLASPGPALQYAGRHGGATGTLRASSHRWYNAGF